MSVTARSRFSADESNPREIVVLWLISFLTFAVGHSVQSGDSSVTLPEARSLGGWAALLVLLLIANDINATSQLALAMAWLIFVSVMLYYGGDLFDKIIQQFGGSNTDGTSIGGSGKKRP